MDPKWWWLIGLVGPFGLIGLVRAVRDAYNDRRDSRAPQFSMAAIDDVIRYRETIEDLLFRVAKLEPGDYLVTDDSDLLDFADTDAHAEQMRTQIRELFGVSTANLANERLVTIAAAIRGNASASN